MSPDRSCSTVLYSTIYEAGTTDSLPSLSTSPVIQVLAMRLCISFLLLISIALLHISAVSAAASSSIAAQEVKKLNEEYQRIKAEADQYDERLAKIKAKLDKAERDLKAAASSLRNGASITGE